MSTLVVLAGALAPAAVLVALAPPGARGRRAMRRADPPRLVTPRPVRPRTARGPASGPLLGSVGHLTERLGAGLRRLSGRPPDPAADRWTGAAVLVAAVAAVLVSPVVAVPVAGLGWAVPAWRRRARRLEHERQVRGALPDAVDLFRLAVGSGLSVHQSLAAVAARAPEPVARPLREVRRRVALGERLGDSLDALDELGDAALPLISALRGAARHGAPLGDALERVAVDARLLRRRRAEEDARRLPVQLLFPLVVCILPAFGVLAVVPLLLASLRSLQL